MPEYGAAVRQTNGLGLTGQLRRYYQDSGVRQRMYEFLGGTDLQSASAVYIAGTDGYSDYTLRSPPSELPEYLEAGLEVDRSLWDHESLIADIDLEYHNFDFPAAPWLDPERAFRLQQPVLDTTLQILANRGVAPMTLVSGRGFHLVWAIRRNSQSISPPERVGRRP